MAGRKFFDVNHMNIIWKMTAPCLLVVFILIGSHATGQDECRPPYIFTTEDYAEFLKNHPYSNRPHLSEEELEKIPKYDRPDLAFEQDFLMTMDPALGYPPKERLMTAIKQVEDYQVRFAGARLPGSTGVNWKEVGPKDVGGRTRALMFDPNDPTRKRVWAGGVSGGLWYTQDITDPNISWHQVSDIANNLSISCIAYDPVNPLTFYVGTGEIWQWNPADIGNLPTAFLDRFNGAGVYKTTNGGFDWIQIHPTLNFVQKLAVHPVTRFIYAATFDGLYRSTDGGLIFTLVKAGNATDVEIAPDNIIWAAFNGDGIYNSADGITWLASLNSSVGLGPAGAIGLGGSYARIEIACSPSDRNFIYSIIANPLFQGVYGIYKSDDAGATWSPLTLPSWRGDPVDWARTCTPFIASPDFTRDAQANYDLIAVVDPTNPNIAFIGGIDIFRTIDGGTTWGQISSWWGACGLQNVHADQHAMIYRPGSANEMIIGNDGGVYYMVGATFGPVIVPRNTGYNVTQFYSCALHPTDPNYLLAGAQDNGTQRFSTLNALPNLSPTVEAFKGDGTYCFVDQDNPLIQIISAPWNSYFKTLNGVAIESEFVANHPIIADEHTGLFVNPADYDDKHDILFTGRDDQSIFRIGEVGVNAASNPEPIMIPGMVKMASHIRVAYDYDGSTTLFVGTSAGQIFKLENANGVYAPPVDISLRLPFGWISSIDVGACTNELLVTYSNYGKTSVWYTNNDGITWQDKESNLPDMPVRWGMFNPLKRNEVLLATEAGVWATEDIHAPIVNWTPSNSGLAKVRVDMLQYRSSDHEVIAATFGRGLFKGKFDAVCTSNTDCDDKNECTADRCVNSNCERITAVGCCPPGCASLEGIGLRTTGPNPQMCVEPACDDLNDCTIDYFNPVTQVCFNDTLDCPDDGILCIDEVCDGGACISVPNPSCCLNNSDCTNDANACTDEVCDANVCIHVPIPGCQPCSTSTQCNLNNACSIDNCVNNVCTHSCIEHPGDGNGSVAFQKPFGGIGVTYVHDVLHTSDGGYVVAGRSMSSGSEGVTVEKLDANGCIVWQKKLSQIPLQAYAICEAGSGGYVIAGELPGTHGSFDFADFGIVKLSLDGTIEWQKQYGGSSEDIAKSIKRTADGGFIVAGHTWSPNNGDVTGNHSTNAADFWVVKVSSGGNLEWQKCLGGTSEDKGYSVDITTDGGFVIAGSAFSFNGDVTSSFGNGDFWVVKLNPAGNIVWNRAMGGFSREDAQAIGATADGGCIVSGFTFSNSGNVTGFHTSPTEPDIWVVKLTSAGAIEWQRAIGGSNRDEAYAALQTSDGNYVIGGYSLSVNGDASPHPGDRSMWVLKLNGTGSILWNQFIPGFRVHDINELPQGAYIIGGLSGGFGSPNGTVTLLGSCTRTTFGEITICEGDSVNIAGQFRRQPGSYTQNLTTVTGCDSIICTYLNVITSCTDDLTVCTIDTCTGGGCAYLPVANNPRISCENDGLSCTTDFCLDGACAHNPFNCTNGNFCTSVTPITCYDSLSGSTVNAPVIDYAPNNCGTDITGPGKWYLFIGNGSAVTVNLCSHATYDTKMNIFEGTCDEFVCIDGNDDECGLRSEIIFNSVAGAKYFILVQGFGGESGDYVIKVKSPVCPCLVNADCYDNDFCTDDVCQTGACLNPEVTCTSDGDLCTEEFCNHASGRCQYPYKDCPDDGDNCTIEGCINGNCMHTPVACPSDENACTADFCDNGSCINQPIACSCNTEVILAAQAVDSLLVDSVTINLRGAITDMDLSLHINHPSINELVIELESPSGTRLRLFDKQCSTETALQFIFDDEGDTLSCPPYFFRRTIPIEQLSAFDGEHYDGEWKLRIADTQAPFFGVFYSEWCLLPQLEICSQRSDCDDADLCTTDSCDAGFCLNAPLICSDSIACTKDSCVNGICTYLFITGCNVDCITLACDDEDACTSDDCIADSGCVFTPVTCVADISGAIFSELGSAIPTVSVSVAGAVTANQTTSNNGSFIFSVSKGENYTITPAKNNDVVRNNGVSTLDIALIRRHILNNLRLNSPYKIIAADVNSSNSLSTIDIVLIRRLILGIDSSFSGKLWNFVPEAFVFNNPQVPFPYESFIIHQNLSADKHDQNFIGMKLGDVNNSWDPLTPKMSEVEEVFFIMEELQATPGQEIIMPVKVKDFRAVSGYQFTLNWNPEVLSLLEVFSKSVIAHYGETYKEQGILTTSWDEISGRSISLPDSSIAFELKFQVKGGMGSYSPIRIESYITRSEAYNNELQLLTVSSNTGIIKVGEVISTALFDSPLLNISVQPNPFSMSTNLIFGCPHDTRIEIAIYDVLGKMVKEFTGDFTAGKHIMQWNGDNNSGVPVSKGIYHVKMVAGNVSRGVKIVLIR